MVVETDDREERTDETESAPSVDSALIGWLSAIHSEVRAQRVEMREYREETRVEMREYREETRAEIRESREETRAEIRESREETRAEIRESREEARAEMRESRRELVERIESVGHRIGRVDDRVGRVEERVGHLEQSMARIEAGIEAERERKNRLIMWLGIGLGAVGTVGALVGAGGVVVAVMGLLN